MINVALINPSEGHSTRGIGFYVKNLSQEFKNQQFSKLVKIYEFSKESDIPRNINIDIVHYPFFELFKHTLPFYSKFKRIVTVHDVIPLKYPNIYKAGIKGSLKFVLQRISLINVDSIITDSYASLVDIKKYLQISDKKINLIPLAPGNHFRKINIQRELNTVKNKYGLSDKFIIYVGDVNFNKNIELLAKSCIENQIELVIVGKNAANLANLDTSHSELSHLNELKKMIENNSLIRTVGFVSDEELVCLYNLATLTCMPSLSEGFGLSVIESLACGTPVMCSNTSSLDEFSDESVFKFDPHSGTELSNLMRDLLSHPSKLSNLSKSAIKYSQNFSWSRVAQDTLNAYKKCL